jgi:hypothetical protein
MKKLVLVLAALLLASPAMSALTVTCEDLGSGQCGVKYTADASADLARGFALSITLDSSATISSIDEESDDYWVNPENIDINDVTGQVDNEGSAVVAGGSGQGSMVIEMGSLHSPTEATSPNAPGSGTFPQTGYLVKFTVSADCNVTVDADASRAAAGASGAVDYSAAEIAAGLPSSCLISAGGCACLGDVADTSSAGPPDGGVNIGDLNKILIAMLTAYPSGDGTGVYDLGLPAGVECADIADTSSAGAPDGTVNIGDLNKMLIQMLTEYPSGDGTGVYQLASCF